MTQAEAWEKEYKDPKLITKHPSPQRDVLKFLRYINKETTIDLKKAAILDLGSGTGRNSNYLAEMGANVTGYEISREAIKIAKRRADENSLVVTYQNINFGEPMAIKDGSIDLILDVISSNSLNEDERGIYLMECHRVLKKRGVMFVKALLLDGDNNAKRLCRKSPGPGPDTYVLKELKLTERVFREKDFLALYSQYFNILKIIKKTSYIPMNNQLYKRRFIIAYLSNK